MKEVKEEEKKRGIQRESPFERDIKQVGKVGGVLRRTAALPAAAVLDAVDMGMEYFGGEPTRAVRRVHAQLAAAARYGENPEAGFTTPALEMAADLTRPRGMGQSPAAKVASDINAQKQSDNQPTGEPVAQPVPQGTQPQSAAPVGETPVPQSKEGELPWKRMSHGVNQMDYRVTEKGQMTPEQTAQANFRDKSQGKSDALLEARGIGGGEDTSIEGIAKMILYDNTLLPAQKASALAKLRNIEAGPNATVQAAKIGADASMANVQKTIDQQIAMGKMGRDLDDPYNRLMLANELGKEKTIEGTETQNPRKGAQLLDEYDKLYRGKKLADHEEYLLENYKKDKKAMRSYDEKFGEGAATRVIALYLEKYLRERDNKSE